MASILPQNVAVDTTVSKNIRLLVYGWPMVGKTYFAATFPNPLMLNTDNNLKGLATPRLHISDVIGETQKVYAWEVLVKAVADVIAGNHEYETIVVDLIEDAYEACRKYYLNKMGVVHEADVPFGKAYTIIKTNFLSLINALCSSKYNVIFLSHREEKKSIDAKGTQKVMSAPSLSDKVRLKIQGRVDIFAEMVGRTIVEPETKKRTTQRFLKMAVSENDATGSRVNVKKNICLPTYTDFMANINWGDEKEA